ncbi:MULTISPECIES: PAS domain-containing protein [Streptomyces]|uniref:PAS domain protein n=2 Tax=Streptomyces TaxID=1883 RepID=A0A117IWX5_9ACTN|nr:MULTISPECIES: PAS domain-containing protein [Streptomyces]KUH39202.1 PAS domain protein [Streptomyces kanasensis]UUS33752.1 PAS domain-containing protein [Streptomyces changanensis]
MSGTDAFGRDLADFVRRVGELRAARALPPEERRDALDTALFELQHVAETLWPQYERLAARAPAGRPAERQESQLLKAVFQRLPLPVALVDGDTAVRRMNQAATVLTGVPAGYATGRPLAALLAPGDRVAFRSQVAAAARGEGGRSLSVRVRPRSEEPVRVTLVALPLPGEPVPAVLVVFQPGADVVEARGAAVPAGGVPGGHAEVLAAGAGADDRAGAGGAGAGDLAGATARASALDVVDAVATALLRRPPGDATGALEAVARVLHGRFADWVLADLTPAGAAHAADRPAPGPRRVAALGPSGEDALAGELAAQEPARCPLVAEVARSASAALQVRLEDPLALGTDAAGTAVLVRAGVGSLLCLPVLDGGGGPQDGPRTPRVLGVLTLLRVDARRAFSMAEARAADVAARHTGIAMVRPG